MDEETLSQSGGVEKETPIEKQDELKKDLEGASDPGLDQETSTTVEEPNLDANLKQDLDSIETTDRHESRPASSASRRASSKRTEEIIQAAARDILAHIEQHNKAKQEGAEPSEPDHDDEALSQQQQQQRQHTSRAARTADDSSSQHEATTDEDVFSDKSPRSSLGSYDFGSETGSKSHLHHDPFPDNLTSVSRSPRISDLSQYEKDEDFVPTIRGAPRPPFRTPSDVRAMQMSSPTQSVVGGVGGGGGSPRSSRRYVPTVSRLGTPTGSASASAQYSPKKTPDRLKPRKEAPLVLLHVTLLPLRWAWGELVGGLGPADLASASRDVRALRDAWRMLQDRLGDTTCERGILLGHPQNDYEVLEERLLEALELPVRRRARILECGHYLGPSNEMLADGGESDREEEDDDVDVYSSDVRSRRSSRKADRHHWCGTCRSDIRYEALGPAGRVFRVKVYASNGLMKAGAWAACWKEMERVDVEIEPIVEPALQDELVRLAATQQEERELAQREEDEIAHEVAQQFEAEKKKAAAAAAAKEQEERGRSRGSRRSRSEMHARVEDVEDVEDDDELDDDIIPPAEEEEEEEEKAEPSIRPSSSTERRRRLEEERLREIYGDSSPAAEEHHEERPSAAASKDPHPSDASAQQPHSDPYDTPPAPHAASEETYDGYNGRRHKLDGASLPQLILESVRVLLQDRKNLAIIALSVFVLLLAVRTARRELPYEPGLHGIVANIPEMRHVPVAEAPHTEEYLSSLQHDVPVAEVPLASTQELEAEVPEVQQVSETQGDAEAAQAPGDQHCLESPAILNIKDVTGQPTSEEHVPTTESVEGCAQQAPVEHMEDSEETVIEASEMSAAAACSTASEVESVILEQALEDATTNDYDACVSQYAASRAAESAAAAGAETEFEIVTQKRTVQVVQTVTETETRFQYFSVTATEFLLHAEPTSSINEGPDAVLCDTINWDAANGDVERKEEPVAEVAVETETDGDSEVEEIRRACPEVDEEAT